jgi:16S rRNA (guanine966-N2)-methyltransferase
LENLDMIRISGGKHKNRKIITTLKSKKYKPDDFSYRPTSDRTRQAAFNIIDNSSKIREGFLKNAIVADVFCGCGSFGIEALSRGAKNVYFIDSMFDQLELTRHNIETLQEHQNASYIKAKAPSLPPAAEKCNLIYLDPPYGSKVIPATLKALIDFGWLADDHIVVIEVGAKEMPALPKPFEIFDMREYGKTKLIFSCLKV